MNIDNKKAKADIEEAQNQIAGMQYNIDDKEAALKAIEDQEKKINETYDERLDALDEVEKANAAINQQQKNQLTLADALTSGDIAAAARAAQEMRAQAAADAVVKEKEALEQARTNELDRATGLDKTDGKRKNRKDLEQEILDLQNKIFEKEESMIEPQEEYLRGQEIILKNSIKGITVAGKTKEQWEQLQNNVELARVRAVEFIDAIVLAMKALDDGKKVIAMYGPQIDPQNRAAADAAAKAAADAALAKAAQDKAAAEAKAAAEKAAAEAKAAADKAALEGASAAEKAAAEAAARKAAEAAAAAKAAAEAKAAADAAAKAAADKAAAEAKAAAEKAAADAAAKAAADKAAAEAKAAADKAAQDAANAVSGASTGGSKTGGTGEVYTVKPGDTLSKIASKNGVSLEDILDANPKFTQDPKYDDGNKIWSGTKVIIPEGGSKSGYSGTGGGGGFGMQMAAMGGLINPMKFAFGGFAKGTDTVPAMLTPGEFIMSKYAVEAHGINTMKAINNGESTGGTVYNNTYTLTVNAKTDANPNDIAQAVMSTIKRVDDRRIRGVSLNGR
jgi:LysM repeat protein